MPGNIGNPLGLANLAGRRPVGPTTFNTPGQWQPGRGGGATRTGIPPPIVDPYRDFTPQVSDGTPQRIVDPYRDYGAPPTDGTPPAVADPYRELPQPQANQMPTDVPAGMRDAFGGVNWNIQQGPGGATRYYGGSGNQSLAALNFPGATMSTTGIERRADGSWGFIDSPFVPNAGEWGALGDPSRGDTFDPRRIRVGNQDINTINGMNFAAESLDQGGGGADFDQWEGHHRRLWEAQRQAAVGGQVEQGFDPRTGFALGGPQGPAATPNTMLFGAEKGGGPPIVNKPDTTTTLQGKPDLMGDPIGTSTPTGPLNPGGDRPPDFSAWDPNLDTVDADMSGLNPLDTDFSGAARRGADAAYQEATQFMDQDFTRDREALESRLVNQGFTRGTEAFNREMEQMMRGQNAARTTAALRAQGIGHSQAGDLLSRSLATRGMTVGERERAADRRFGQGLGIANLGLGARGQDLSRYGIDTSRRTTMDTAGLNADLALRRLGLDEDDQGMRHLLALISSARGGVNAPNFGGTSPLDVGSAFNLASQNRNNQMNRDASDRSNWFNLAGALLGGLWG